MVAEAECDAVDETSDAVADVASRDVAEVAMEESVCDKVDDTSDSTSSVAG